MGASSEILIPVGVSLYQISLIRTSVESSSVTAAMIKVGAPAPIATLSVVKIYPAVSAGAAPSANDQMDTESPFTTIFFQNHES